MTRSEWTSAIETHDSRLRPWSDAFVGRRSRGEKHPVHDFLFTYYSFPPAKLKQWVPAVGVVLEGVDADDRVTWPWLQSDRFSSVENSLTLDTSRLDARARSTAKWIAELCDGILARPSRFRCFGLHEWAMVYRQAEEQVRHSQHALRLTAPDLARFVESQALCCTHYDAFRFFTPEARPLNSFTPTLVQREQMEQGGCLHANMDLYKWAVKLWPWAGADLIADCFFLALEGRDLDMRASPYDLAALGYDPVRIETPEGREIYENEQRKLAEKATPIRLRLKAAAQAVCQGGID